MFVSVCDMVVPTRMIVAGKGGSGKSTMTTLIARFALKKGRQVIVVDADESNPGIQRMIGSTHVSAGLMDSVGGREHVFGTEKDASSEKVRNAVESVMQEAKGSRLYIIEVGKVREAGSGCACPHGAITREILSYPLSSETLLLVDAEAGVEHFGRGIDSKVDMILFIVDPSYDSVVLCREAKRLADSIKVKLLAVLNKVDSENTSAFLKEELNEIGVDVRAILPYDEEIVSSTLQGKPLEAGSAIETLQGFLDEMLD